ncbi:fatty acid CoA ligase family protein [Pirellulaceae bacterium]|nr:fatty acid CoA ligase family protein [Pirellulaceae bacterium]
MNISNVGLLLSQSAKRNPDQIAVAAATDKRANGKRLYDQITFQQLNDDTNRIAAGLIAAGARPGMRLALLVKPGVNFIKLVFAMFKANVVTILIDPGMGRKNMIRCLSEAEPEGFVAIPMAQAIRCLMRSRFPKADFNVTVGRRYFWGGTTLSQVERLGAESQEQNGEFITENSPEDSAAIIFTTGSTGPPKGVLYQHKNFVKQAEEIRDYYQIEPGGIDISGFPLFALFNAGMGMTTIVPKMDFTKPAEVDPQEIIDAVNDWKATQSFGSPALWTTVGRYCEENNVRLPTLKRVLTAGAPVPPHVLRRLKSIVADDGDIFTPYGATESLPVASISATTVLNETAALTETGKGTCVGNRFPGMESRVIEISDEPIESIEETKELPANEIGELIVRGDVVTREYVTRTDANALHKIKDDGTFWHRMGDVGYLDDQERFWFCGRKGHRVQTSNGVMFTIPCEAIFNLHPAVYRSALIGIGSEGNKVPVLVVETWPEKRPRGKIAENQLRDELYARGRTSELTSSIFEILLIKKMPVDIRHNSKIFREKLVIWAEPRVKLPEGK